MSSFTSKKFKVFETPAPRCVQVEADEAIVTATGRLVFTTGWFVFREEVAAWNAGAWASFREVTHDPSISADYTVQAPAGRDT